MYPPTTARERPDDLAYVMAGSGERLTYDDLDRRSNRVAHYLRRHGVAPGSTMVIVMENNLAWPVVVAAGMRTGLFVTPVNWHLTGTELAILLDEAAPDVIVTSAALAETVVAAVAALPVTPLVLCADGAPEGCADLAAATAGLPETPVADELLGARVLYSGGTTGRPKRFAQQLLGVHPADAPQRHSGLVTNLGVDEHTVLLSPAPNYHAAPFTFQLITLAAGGTVVCMERFDAAGAMAAISIYGVTHSQWVPTMLIRLLRLPDRERLSLSPTHRVAFTSGAPCPVHVKEQILDWWGDILHEYYGASEGYGHTYINPKQARAHPGSVGRPLGATRVHIVDDSGAEVPAGVDGRVCFEALWQQAYRSPGAAGGKLKQMGDIGHLDDDGFLYLVGRAGFMIISGGVNIYPDEVEAALLTHPAIADVGVIGVPDAEFGESVKAVVELRPGRTAAPADIIAYSRDRIAHFKAPRIVEVTADLPRLATGKLDKRALVARFATPPVQQSESTAHQGERV
ncbi:fatty-acid--CoA ligase [Gordonia oryzae]|uniref:Fatty-acid--CoA ligase n=1 Tax=Gordonia oryzae TaxID=2487349 RepID=A0A3N4H1I6_9ACTN|nr:AMP-binding protein [Gordonia oryzae]RPA64690.1 fatty-acid--CoA ligase [Gordonia oryzae]